MSIRAKSCFEVVCDGGCDDPWEEGTPHFDTVTEAIECVRSYGWVVVGDRALCPTCATKEECAITGHQWPERWISGDHQGIPYRMRFCDNCNVTEYDPPFEQIYVLVKAAEVVDGTEEQR